MDDEGRHFVHQNAFKLLASARVSYEGRKELYGKENNYFKSAEWSPDGACIITNSADNHIRTFIIPPDLLDNRDEPLQLQSYSAIPSFEPVNALACYPNYNLQDVSTTLVLSTASEHPIRLNSALTGGRVASYPLISPTTEAYIKPQSLLFTSDGGQFLAGSDSLISMFDLSRPGEEPLLCLKTGPRSSKSAWSNPVTSLRGLVSALAIDGQYSVLAAGTLSRQVGLYDSTGQGDCIGVFSVAGTEADQNISGSGITQVLWSRCGRYLYVAERKSDGCLIYDIRNTGQLLSWATGRKALTNQRMKVELAVDQATGNENIWAGGTDGVVRCWQEPHLKEEAIGAASSFFAHNDPVNSVSMHSTADVLATASGQRAFMRLDHGKQDTEPSVGLGKDDCLKLWHYADVSE